MRRPPVRETTHPALQKTAQNFIRKLEPTTLLLTLYSQEATAFLQLNHMQ